MEDRWTPEMRTQATISKKKKAPPDLRLGVSHFTDSDLRPRQIRSTVLGGKVLTEIRNDGTKKQTNVYAGDAVIAEQMSSPPNAQHPTE